jgi:hypothetical protein
MVQTSWRAVGIGFGIIFLINLVSSAFAPLALLGGLVAGIVGGWAAGYYARMGRVDGAWNGFLAGSIGAIVVVAVLLALGLVVSLVELSFGGALATLGAGAALLMLIVFNAIPATIGGYIGGIYPRRETEETGRPAA